MTRIRTYILMLALCAGIAGTRAYAQENRAERFAERYNLLVSKLGADGVAVYRQIQLLFREIPG